MSASGKIILIRHGATDSTVSQKLCGVTDISLNSEGRAQAARLAQIIKSENPGVIFSSPLSRARETAEAISKTCGCGVIYMSDLAEADFGDWENLPFSEIETKWPKEFAGYLELADGFKFPGGESLAKFTARVDRTAESILSKNAGGCVAVVSHGGVIRRLIMSMVERDRPTWNELHISPCGFAVIEKMNGKRALSAQGWV